jgi:hypothetical protein
MTTDLDLIPTISSFDLEQVTGGAGVGVDAKVDIKGDVSQTIRDVGNGAARLIGCATGADSLREFGNCMLTGQLGNVPQSPSQSQLSAAPAGDGG